MRLTPAQIDIIKTTAQAVLGDDAPVTLFGPHARVPALFHQPGRCIDTADAQIAGIALVTNLELVTRKTKDFVGIEGLKLHNPWQDH